MKHASRAFTLVEVLLALAISGMIGAAAMMMLTATGNATQTQHDTRRATVKRQVVFTRITPLLRDAARVLDHGDAHLVLWTGDLNRNAKPDLSELRRIEWTAGNEVVVYEAPPNLAAVADTTYELTHDFDAATAALAGSAAFPGRVTLRGVTDFNLMLDAADPAAARTIRLRLTVATESGDDTSVVVAALRASDS